MPSRHRARIKQKRTIHQWFFSSKAQLRRAFDTSARKKFRLPELFSAPVVSAHSAARLPRLKLYASNDLIKINQLFLRLFRRNDLAGM